jgi:hypothetical protein
MWIKEIGFHRRSLLLWTPFGQSPHATDPGTPYIRSNLRSGNQILEDHSYTAYSSRAVLLLFPDRIVPTENLIGLATVELTLIVI